MRMVAGAEAFTDAMLAGMLDREATFATIVLSRILEDYTVDVMKTWSSRRDRPQQRLRNCDWCLDI